MRERVHIMTLNLPLPPSVNNAFVARYGSHRTAKSGAYKFWLNQVDEEMIGGPELHPGPYGLWVGLPVAMRGDIDNRVKLLSDVLHEKLAVVSDDKLMRGLYVGRVDGMAADRCAVTVVSWFMWPSYCKMRFD